MTTTTVKLYPSTTAFLVEFDHGQVKVSVLNVADGGYPQDAGPTGGRSTKPLLY
jgi:hypothetical protein